MELVQPHSTWRNNKNQHLYKVLFVAKHSETLEKVVVYVSEKRGFWVRPYNLFLEKFTFVEDQK